LTPEHVRIERLRETDWERLRAIRLSALRSDSSAFGTTYAQCSPWPESRWREQLRVLTTFVAMDGGRDVAMVRGVEHESVATGVYLISMWVAPESRRRGLGRSLITAVCDWARSIDRLDVFLDVREHNIPAIALYEANGFRPTGRRTPEPPPEDHIVEAQYRLHLG
jgi:ribosomal protein S18 acetylase RimI-like enzyme